MTEFITTEYLAENPENHSVSIVQAKEYSIAMQPCIRKNINETTRRGIN